MTVDVPPDEEIDASVDRMLDEDLGSGDLTASLVPASSDAGARIVTREPMVLAGAPWVDAIYRRLDAHVAVDWRTSDGAAAAAGATLCDVSGPARAILSGERAALNLLQTLSATATQTARYVEAIDGTSCRILDTRKTLPGLRVAQKYAVRCGGGHNHRFGLYDAILIKENHIASAGSIAAAVGKARREHPDVQLEVEVENLDELRLARGAGAGRILLDNFSLEDVREAVRLNRALGEPAVLEASGNVTLETVRRLAETGVDFISVGALTKNVHAIDLSMLFHE